MEISKYYTPTIEELNVNQEVYLLDTDNYKLEYTKDDIYPMLCKIIQLSDYPTIWVSNGNKIYEVYLNQLGLKYLDQSDIESLGIKVGEWFISKGKYGGTYKLETTSFGFTPKITIKTKNFIRDASGRYDELTIIYRLPIKNKSELKVLMKQLGINE